MNNPVIVSDGTPEGTFLVSGLNQVYQDEDASTNDAVPGILHGKLQQPMTDNGFYFDMTINAIATSAAATLEFDLASQSLIGWNGDGTPRTSNSSISTAVQIGYEAKEFVIGGINKKEVVRSVSGLPFTKDLPVIGFLFGSESESIKSSMIVLIATAEYSQPSDPMPAVVAENVGKITDEIVQGENAPLDNIGFQQLLLDE